MVGDSPSFARPPLDEVVIGVQFTTPRAYTSTINGVVRAQFSSDYPGLAEHQPLEPQIEVFGGNPVSGVELKFGPRSTFSRLWFLSRDESHLIQYQADRLLLNWRSRPRGTPYPRHERMISQFASHLSAVEKTYFESFGAKLDITQAEVSYFNVIPIDRLSDVGQWLKFINSGSIDLEGINANFGRVITAPNGQPVARLYYELQTVMQASDPRHRAIRFVLTYRGKPGGPAINEALDFIQRGRNEIVGDFCRLTTESAQTYWGREK